MEATVVYWGYIGIMGKKMETTTVIGSGELSGFHHIPKRQTLNQAHSAPMGLLNGGLDLGGALPPQNTEEKNTSENCREHASDAS